MKPLKLIKRRFDCEGITYRFEEKNKNLFGGDAPWKLTSDGEMVAYVEAFTPIIRESFHLYFRVVPYDYRIRKHAMLTGWFNPGKKLVKFFMEFDENQIQLMGIEHDSTARYRCSEITNYTYARKSPPCLTWRKWFQPGEEILLESNEPIPKGFE